MITHDPYDYDFTPAELEAVAASIDHIDLDDFEDLEDHLVERILDEAMDAWADREQWRFGSLNHFI